MNDKSVVTLHKAAAALIDAICSLRHARDVCDNHIVDDYLNQIMISLDKSIIEINKWALDITRVERHG